MDGTNYMSNKLIALEQDYWSRGHTVLGIDEAGYGCLAGSMYVAGVSYPKHFIVPSELDRINDSKKLTESTRFVLADYIKKYAQNYFILKIGVDEINNSNPYWLRFSVVTKYINDNIALFESDTRVIYDGDRSVTGISLASEALVKGDAKSFSIASASILAKTAKDAEMIELSKLYPMYNFEDNKGYGTATHISALQTYGLSVVHRKQYCSKYG
jgi:ribonuclease HII